MGKFIAFTKVPFGLKDKDETLHWAAIPPRSMVTDVCRALYFQLHHTGA